MESMLRNLTEDTEDTQRKVHSFTELPFLPRFILVFYISLTILCNLLVLAVLARSRSCLTRMQLFLQSLAVADLMVGLMWLLLYLESILGLDLYSLSNWLCLLVVILPAVSLAISVQTLSLISVERYIAVVKPLHYQKIINRRRARCCLISIWLLTFLLFVPVYVGLLFTRGELPLRHCESTFEEVMYTSMYMVMIVIVPNMFLSFYCYGVIIRCLFLRAKFLGKQNQSICRRRSQDQALAKISISIYSGFYISWLPFVIISFGAYVGLLEVGHVLYYSTLNSGMCNSFFNCLIYSISHRPFRQEVKRLLLSLVGCCFCCRRRRQTAGRRADIGSSSSNRSALKRKHRQEGQVKSISRSISGTV